MEVVITSSVKQLEFKDLEIGEVYVTGSKGNQIFLCCTLKRIKCLVRLSDGLIFYGYEINNSFAPVKATLTIE